MSDHSGKLHTTVSGAAGDRIYTLGREYVEVLFEGVCGSTELQESQVAVFPHLQLLLLLPPHCHYDLMSIETHTHTHTVQSQAHAHRVNIC